MKYISLFSGIGGFELGIQRALGDKAHCIGFSEIDKFALQVYKEHFPSHTNLGNVTTITEEHIKKLVKQENGCDMLVGGFPCTNLTSLAQVFKNCNSDGLDGPSSGLFWNMLNIIQWIRKYNGERKLHIVIENNASMTTNNKTIITDQLQSCFDYPIYLTALNGSDFGVQIRRRIFWTTFELDVSGIVCEQTWGDVLVPIEDAYKHIVTDGYINKGNKRYVKDKCNPIHTERVRDQIYRFIVSPNEENNVCSWQKGYHNDNGMGSVLLYKYIEGKCRPVVRRQRFDNILIDRRVSNDPFEFIIRHFSSEELARLFWFPDDWCSSCSKCRQFMLYGNTVIVNVIEFILKEFLMNVQFQD